MTPWWQPFLAALGGAVVGGLITLTAGWLADGRRLRSERVDRARRLSADLLAGASAVKRTVERYRTELAFWRLRPNNVYNTYDEQPEFDPARVEAYLLQIIRAGGELLWIVGDHSRIDIPTKSLIQNTANLAGLWRADDNALKDADSALTNDIGRMNTALADLSKLKGRPAANFLAGT